MLTGNSISSKIGSICPSLTPADINMLMWSIPRVATSIKDIAACLGEARPQKQRLREHAAPLGTRHRHPQSQLSMATEKQGGWLWLKCMPLAAFCTECANRSGAFTAAIGHRPSATLDFTCADC